MSRDCHVLQLQLTPSWVHLHLWQDKSALSPHHIQSTITEIFYLYSDLAGEARKLAVVLSAIALQFPQFWYLFPKRFIWKLFCNIPEGNKSQENSAASENHKKEKKVCGIHNFKMWQFPWYSIRSQLSNLSAIKCIPRDTDWAGCTRSSDVSALLKAGYCKGTGMCSQRCSSHKAWEKGHTIIYQNTQWRFYLQHVSWGDSKPFCFMHISSDPVGFGKWPKFG